jgi:predicted acetyltransferase
LTEIRPIQSSDAEAFLRILCDVFQLNHAQATRIFHRDPNLDWNRKWALFESGRMTTILTTSPMQFGWGKAVGIAGVATLPSERGRGLAACLIQEVLAHGEAHGEGPAMLFAHEEGLYRRCGFEVADRVIRGEVIASTAARPADRLLSLEEVQELYAVWAADSAARLQRTERSWRSWTWTMKHCVARPGGYVCVEPATIREAILEPSPEGCPVDPGHSFYGLARMAESLQVPLKWRREELLVMTRSFPHPPEMFMTDQF